jgi:hypothetical protein
MRVPLGALRQASELLADPSRIPAAGLAAYDTVRAIVVELSDTERARSPLWQDRSLRRRLDVLRAPVDATKAAAKDLGGTLNTAFVTVAAAAAGGTTPSWKRRSTTCGRRWRSAPAPRTRGPTPTPSPACWCPPPPCP